MLAALRENFILKAISLLASIVLWLYVTADRYPNTVVRRTVGAEVVRMGAAAADLSIRVGGDALPVELVGPKAEVDAIVENGIKAEVDLRTARAGATQLRIAQYRKPAGAPNVEVHGPRFVLAEVVPRVSKTLPITPLVNAGGAGGRRAAEPRITPEWAKVTGAPDDVKRIVKLVVPVETGALALNADVPVRAVDRDGVEVTGVEVQPTAAHVELSLPEPPAVRTLVVDAAVTGQPAAGYRVTGVQVEPAQIAVQGRPQLLLALSNLAAREVSVADATGDVTRDVPIRLPSGVTAVTGRDTVRVTVKVEGAAPAPAGSPP
jgi:YbbR domain-containing protein